MEVLTAFLTVLRIAELWSGRENQSMPETTEYAWSFTTTKLKIHEG
jgi:hypothetical protein